MAGAAKAGVMYDIARLCGTFTCPSGQRKRRSGMISLRQYHAQVSQLWYILLAKWGSGIKRKETRQGWMDGVMFPW